MQRTCTTCQIVYGGASDDLLLCPGCGNQLPPPLAAKVAAGMTVLDEQSAARDRAGLTGQAIAIQVSQALRPANPQSDSAEMSGLVPASQPKSPGLAALLSFLLVGMGQVYLGQEEKGLCMLGVVLLLIMNAVLGPLGIVILLFNVLDAFLLGRKVKEGRQIGKWQFFFQSK